jgi:hypothetical protein
MKKTLTLLAAFICLPCMAQITNVNIGSYPNAGNGDTARTAFDKINNNFDYVESQILSLPSTNAPIFLDTTLQGVTTNSGVISGGALTNVDGTGVVNVNAAKLNGYTAANFIVSGSQMNFDGGSITSDGSGDIYCNSVGDPYDNSIQFEFDSINLNFSGSGLVLDGSGGMIEPSAAIAYPNSYNPLVDDSGNLYLPTDTPSDNAPGSPGEIQVDGNYIYVWTGPTTVKRVPLNSF